MNTWTIRRNPTARKIFYVFIGTLFLFSLSASTINAQDLAGEWAGTVNQKGPGEETSSYPAKMVLNGDSGSMDYHTLQCGGQLTFFDKKGNRYFYRESITYGKDKCIDGGMVAVEPAEGSVLWAWNGSGVTAGGKLVGNRR